MKNKFAIWLFILWIIVIISVSSIPHLKSPGPDKIGIDKLYHFSEYFILSLIFLKLIYHKFNPKLIRILMGLMLLLPIIDELHQTLIPGRQCSGYDVLADILGLLTPFIIMKIFYRKI